MQDKPDLMTKYLNQLGVDACVTSTQLSMVKDDVVQDQDTSPTPQAR